MQKSTRRRHWAWEKHRKVWEKKSSLHCPGSFSLGQRGFSGSLHPAMTGSPISFTLKCTVEAHWRWQARLGISGSWSMHCSYALLMARSPLSCAASAFYSTQCSGLSPTIFPCRHQGWVLVTILKVRPSCESGLMRCFSYLRVDNDLFSSKT